MAGTMGSLSSSSWDTEMKQFQRIVGYAISLGGAAVLLSRLL